MEATDFPDFGAPYLRILTLIFPGLKCIKSVCSWRFEITKKIHIKVFTEKSYSQKTWFFDLQQAKSESNIGQIRNLKILHKSTSKYAIFLFRSFFRYRA